MVPVRITLIFERERERERERDVSMQCKDWKIEGSSFVANLCISSLEKKHLD